MNPVDTRLAELDRTLRGPARLKRCLLAEVRDGLDDAVAAHREAGLDEAAAHARAAAEFGGAAEVAPLFQRELVAAQARSTAVLLASAFPALMLGWDLLWRSGVVAGGPAGPVVGALARLQDIGSWTVAIGALAVLAVLGRGAARAVDPRRQARLIAGIGKAGALTCGGASLAMNLVALPYTARLLTSSPLVAAAYLTSAVILVLVIRSVRRTWRLVRPD